MATEIARIAVAPGSLIERADALLRPLRRVLRFDAAWISLLDPERRMQPALVCQGYPDVVQRYVNGPALMDDVELVGLHQQNVPLRLTDSPVPISEVPVWAEYLHPAGFGQGIAVPLATPDGRYLGMFNANTEDRAAIGDDVRDLLAALAPLIAHAVDPLRTLAALAGVVAGAVAGVALTRAGDTVALPGLPADRLLAAGSPVPVVAGAAVGRGEVQTKFLAPRDGTDAAELVQVTGLACPPQPPGYLRAVLLISPAPQLHGLTRRELEVLGLLVEGHSVAAIAAALTASVRTTTGHLEHIMVKLGAGTRAMAAVRALRQGLYLPSGLLPADGDDR
ncbi:helix-turn-helix transcriptional regulator [Couchioplanes azureus]|uniref:helix-turn-helix transcriptional regulator n=1 Tax=Couchioplanes caeruleus TaxID=56438 RepID=UPI00188B1A0F|nr:helix-turn-helix transcriptional regulator [Couchioplanes caeruleus]